MNIPKEFQLGGFKITVDFDFFADREGANGLAMPEDHRICLSPSIDKSMTEMVFLHEVIELINSYAELNLTHPAIQALAMGLHQALVSGKGRAK